MKLAKNIDLNKCGYSGYGIGFVACSKFSLSIGEQVKKLLFLM